MLTSENIEIVPLLRSFTCLVPLAAHLTRNSFGHPVAMADWDEVDFLSELSRPLEAVETPKKNQLRKHDRSAEKVSLIFVFFAKRTFLNK